MLLHAPSTSGYKIEILDQGTRIYDNSIIDAYSYLSVIQFLFYNSWVFVPAQ